MLLKDFLLSSLFDIETTKGFDKNKLNFTPDGKCDFIGRTTLNWGVQGTLNELKTKPNPKNVFSLIQVGETSALWREREWYASQNLFILKPKYKGVIDNFLYFQGCINKQMTVYGKDYGSYPTLKKLNDTVISLPTLTNPDNSPVIDPEHKYHPEGYIPDWEYMQDYIKELEQDYIRELERHNVKELEQYLIAAGLNDYELTDEDREVLEKINERLKNFRVGDLFDIHPTNAYKMNNEALKKVKGNNIILSNSSINNGVGGYCGRDNTEKGNIITFSDTTTGSDTMFYQSKDFIGYPHVQGMYPYDKEHWKEKQCLYFISAMRKAAGTGWSYSTKFTRKLVTEMKPLIPIKLSADNSPIIDPAHQYHPEGYVPDWEYMEKYIKVIEKLVIKDAVKYKDEMIGKMKEIIKEGKNTNITQLKYKDVILLKAKNIIEEIAGYTNPNDGKYINCFRHISFSIEDLMCLNDYVNEMGFNTTINKINELYESVKTIILNMCEKCFEETENTKYFKFVRDIVNHPDGISSKKYLDDNIYKEYINTNENKIILKDISYDVKNRGYLMFPSTSKRIFNKKYKDEFGLIIDLVNPKFIMLVCPYDKLFDCILDLMSQLKINYISLDDTTLEWGDDEDKMEPKNDQQFY